MNKIRNPIDTIIAKAKDFYIEDNYVEEKKCYEKIWTVYKDNITTLTKLLNFQISIERWEAALTTGLLIREIRNSTDIINNIALLNVKLKKFEESEKLYKESLLIEENFTAYEGIGYINFLKEDFKEAKNYYNKAKNLQPQSYAVFNQLGVIYRSLGDYKEAKRNFQKAIEINNSISTSFANLINLEISYGAPLEEILLLIEKNKEVLIEEEISKIKDTKLIKTYRLYHAYQQILYLESIKKINQYQEIYKKFFEEKILAEKIKNNSVNLEDSEIKIVSDIIRNGYSYKPKSNLDNYLNRNNNWNEIEDQYFNSSPSVVIVDNFLDSIALEEIRNYLLESSIWNETYYHSNYIGAFCGKGNYSTIHHGILIELNKLLPNILKELKFEQLWSFNYNNLNNKGIEAHADFAKVNINFWLTPDSFNKEKDQGGLKIYQTPAPADWNFIDYNTRNENMDKLLKNQNNNYITIPYKFNRAVIFDSSLFHETQHLSFEDHYEARRINSTILFGNRY